MTSERRFRLARPVDLWLTLGPLRHGLGDPTVHFGSDGVWRATRTPEGPATLHLAREDGVIRAVAWGRGAAWALETAPELVGATDDPERLVPRHAVVRDLQRRLSGLLMGRTRAVVEALLPAIVEQKVTGLEARRAYRRLVLAYGEPAPGPVGLWLPPAPQSLAGIPYFALHPLGLERRRAEVIGRVCALADHIEAATTMEAQDARRRLTAIPGIGPWTAAEVARAALGDPDAVSVGDFHLPSLVSWMLAGEPRGDDLRMLELLEPYRGQRGRVVRLLEASGLRPPRFGPRMPARAIERL